MCSTQLPSASTYKNKPTPTAYSRRRIPVCLISIAPLSTHCSGPGRPSTLIKIVSKNAIPHRRLSYPRKDIPSTPATKGSLRAHRKGSIHTFAHQFPPQNLPCTALQANNSIKVSGVSTPESRAERLEAAAYKKLDIMNTRLEQAVLKGAPHDVPWMVRGVQVGAPAAQDDPG